MGEAIKVPAMMAGFTKEEAASHLSGIATIIDKIKAPLEEGGKKLPPPPYILAKVDKIQTELMLKIDQLRSPQDAATNNALKKEVTEGIARLRQILLSREKWREERKWEVGEGLIRYVIGTRDFEKLTLLTYPREKWTVTYNEDGTTTVLTERGFAVLRGNEVIDGTLPKDEALKIKEKAETQRDSDIIRKELERKKEEAVASF